MQEPFALLDDSTAPHDQPCSRLYTGHCRTLGFNAGHSFATVLDEMQQALAEGLHAVAVLPYELGYQIAGMEDDSDLRDACILLFRHCQSMDATQVTEWLDNREDNDSHQAPSCISHMRTGTSEAAFYDAIARIHGYIEEGHTYQVNYTMRLHFDAHGSVYALYAALRSRQAVPYGALIGLPDGSMVVSLSPELFTKHSNGIIMACPMKGTAPASQDDGINAERVAALQADAKTRAENLMIVDLLRNDLGRIARPGSVEVSDMFAVTRFGDVLQMTSTIHARLREETRMADIIAAIYPCGSVTGAPKRRAMEIIRELEETPRGIYTGAIGWFAPSQGSQDIGDFCLSVPIRTLMLRPAQGGYWHGELGVGAGIVHDSRAAEEYEECWIKAGFLTRMPHAFELFETMLVTDAGCPHLERHLLRLSRSAHALHIPLDMQALRLSIDETLTHLAPGADYRLRLTVAHDGHVTIARAKMAPLKPSSAVVYISPVRTPREALFLSHKTTVRDHYDTAWKLAEQHGGFDMLFFNEDGELTEGGRTNVFVKLDGHWYTPPLSSGLLPGVMRAVLLDDPAWQASERVLTMDDLQRADEVIVCNALRGIVPVQVDFTACVIDDLCISL